MTQFLFSTVYAAFSKSMWFYGFSWVSLWELCANYGAMKKDKTQELGNLLPSFDVTLFHDGDGKMWKFHTLLLFFPNAMKQNFMTIFKWPEKRMRIKPRGESLKPWKLHSEKQLNKFLRRSLGRKSGIFYLVWLCDEEENIFLDQLR